MIQATFVVEFFLLAMTALFFGLYQTQDPLSHHLTQYQKGRHRTRQALKRLDQMTAPSLDILTAASVEDAPTTASRDLPLIRIAAAKDHPAAGSGSDLTLVDAVNKMQQQLQLGLQLVSSETTVEACEMAFESTKDSPESLVHKQEEYSIVICPQGSKEKQQQVLVRQGMTYIYADNSEQVKSLLQKVLELHSNEKVAVKRKPLKISLMVEQQRKDWDYWAQALSNWIRQNQESLQAWPCLRGAMETEVVLSTLVESPTQSNKTSEVTATEENKSVRLISMMDMKASVLDPIAARDKEDYWNVVLFIPRQAPAQFVGNATDPQSLSPAMHVANSLVMAVDQVEAEAEYRIDTNTSTSTQEGEGEEGTKVPVSLESLVDRAMLPLSAYLGQHCLGIGPSDEDKASTFIDSDNTVPLWQLEAWLQRTLAHTYRQTRAELREEAEWLLQSSTWVVIDNSVADHWERLVDFVSNAYQTITTEPALNILNINNNGGGYGGSIEQCLKALSHLEDAMEDVAMLRTDPSLMEPLRFSAPQFLAIFAPLCLPLFLPHFIGLLREWKRYKKVRDQNKSKEV